MISDSKSLRISFYVAPPNPPRGPDWSLPPYFDLYIRCTPDGDEMGAGISPILAEKRASSTTCVGGFIMGVVRKVLKKGTKSEKKFLVLSCTLSLELLYFHQL